MKISLNWVSDFVDVKDELNRPADLAEALTQAGLEVEEVIDGRRVYDQVVVGLILERDKHPNADRLTVCRVTTGEGVVHQIVCGATNHKAGDRVVVALPGAVLPGGLAIQRGVIRGVESGGMLCSTQELGMTGDADGILILPAAAVVGRPFAEQMGLNDVVFEVKVTPNRADCLSHYGLAREIACLRGRPLKESPPPAASGAGPAPTVVPRIEDPAACSRYAGRVVRGVKVTASPAWLRSRLEAVGVKSINNVVDVTNYVMFELGQPMHAFDLTRLEGGTVTVGTAQGDEKFITLDGREVKLQGGETVIRDGGGVVALAGVIGGQRTGVTEATTDVFLESAHFSAALVRRASRRHGIQTESAYRFSRGVDAELVPRALARAAELLREVAGGTVEDALFDSNPKVLARPPIDIELAYVSQRLGYAAEDGRFRDVMTRLGCRVETLESGRYRIHPPGFRFDLEQDMDLVEEYARLNGYHLIPETLPTLAVAPAAHEGRWCLAERVHRALRSQGWLQAWNFGFTSAKGERAFIGPLDALQACGVTLADKPITLRNPLSEEWDVLRGTLCEGLFRNMIANVRHGNEEGGLYEIGQTFHADAEAGSIERTRLALVGWGRPRSLFTKTQQHPVVYDLKAAMEGLLEGLRISAFRWVMPSNRGEVPAFCHSGQFARLEVEGKAVGFVATVHPRLLEEQKVRVPVAIAEFDLETLLKGQPRPYRVAALSKFPAVERDFSFVMPKSLRVAEVMAAIRKSGGGLLTGVDVFDLYEGDKLAEGEKSVSFRLTFQDSNATLQEGALAEIQNRILAALKEAFAIEIR